MTVLDLLYMTGPLWLRLQCFCDIGHLVHDADDKIQEVMFNELPVFATEAKSTRLWMSKGFKTTHVSSAFMYTVHACAGVNRKQIFCLVCGWLLSYRIYSDFHLNFNSLTTYLLLFFYFPLYMSAVAGQISRGSENSIKMTRQ